MAYTPFNTGNPIGTWGSVDPRDLVDNAAILDRWVNDQTITQWRDRFGIQRLTWNGMEVAFQQAQDDRQVAFDAEQAEHQADFDAAQAQREADFNSFLLASGYQFIGDYDTDGPLTITQVNQIFSKDGEFWRAGAALTLPYTTVNDWEIDEANFVSVGDAALRQELAEDDGANKVGWSRHSLSSAIANVHQALDAQVVSVWEFAGLISSIPNPSDTSTWDWSPAFEAALALGIPVEVTAPFVYGHSKISITQNGARLYGSGTLKKLANIDEVGIEILADDVTIEGLSFDGTNAQLTATLINDTIRIGNVETLAGAARATVRNCRVIGGKGNGVGCFYSPDAVIEGNYFEGTGLNGVIVAGLGSDGARIRNNRIRNNLSQNGIFVTASPSSIATSNYIYNVAVVDNDVRDCADTGIEIGIHTVDSLVRGNYVENCANPLILLRDCIRATVSDNKLSLGSSATANGDGIAVVPQVEAETWAYQSQIHGNSIRHGYGRSGIHIGGSNVSVKNNRIVDVVTVPDAAGSNLTKRGITLAPTTGLNDVEIVGNVVRNMLYGIDGNYGAVVNAAMNNVLLDGNNVRACSIGINTFRWNSQQSSVCANRISRISDSCFVTASHAGNGTLLWENNQLNPAGFTAVGSTGEAPPSDSIRSQYAVYDVAITPSAVAPNTSVSQVFTVNGVLATDAVFVSPPTGLSLDGLVIGGAHSPGANQVRIRFGNLTAGALTPGAGTYRFAVLRK